MTHQGIHLIGVLTEAIHTPWMQDRYLALENSRYIMNNARHLGDEIEFKEGGRIETRARETLQEAVEQLRGIREKGMFRAIEERAFAGVTRSETSGRGYDGVFERAPNYLNVFEEQLRQRLELPPLLSGAGRG
jgi:beta-lysine 5,6-aminomutase alpha subunit